MPTYEYHPPSLDGVQLEVSWKSPTRIDRHEWQNPGWLFAIDCGVRRPGPGATPGYVLWNPYAWVRVLGLFLGVGVCYASYPYEVVTVRTKSSTATGGVD